MAIAKSADAIKQDAFTGRDMGGVLAELYLKALRIFGLSGTITGSLGVGSRTREWLDQSGHISQVSAAGGTVTVSFENAFPGGLQSVVVSGDTRLTVDYANTNASQLRVNRSDSSQSLTVFDYHARGW
jgi:hypothetical protein